MRRIPKIEAITEAELCRWRIYGPIVGQDEEFSTWDEWAAVYESLRPGLLDKIKARRDQLSKNPTLSKQIQTKEPACEQLYKAIQAGRDPEALLKEIRLERIENDPRKNLGGGEFGRTK